MKTLLLTLLFCTGTFYGITAQVVSGEAPKTPKELYHFHNTKKKQNFTVAFITLGGGAAMILGGMSQNLDNCIFDDCNDGMPLAYTGVLVGLSSIYFFERGFTHKKKAKLQLQSKAVGINKDVMYTGLRLTIEF